MNISFTNIEQFYFISDIHSNYPALSSVLNLIPNSSLIICCGDILGYYINVNEVCDLLRKRGVLCIKGNHDKYVTGELNYNYNFERKYRILDQRKRITAKNLSWLSSLPDYLNIKIDNNNVSIRLKISHGYPGNIERYIYPDSDLSDLFFTEDILVCGHTHHPMLREHNDKLIVNPGSIGQPRNRVPGASYAKFNMLDNKFTFYNNSYDINAYTKVLSQSDVDISMCDILLRKR